MVLLSAKRTILKKIAKAESILEEEKEELLKMVTDDGIDAFGSPRDFLPLIEEDAKYRIKALHLPEKFSKYYLAKLCEIYGPFSEDQPNLRKKYYDNDLYMSSGK